MGAHSYMRSSNFKILAATVVLLIASRGHAQNSEPPPYLNPALPAEQRAADLVHRMTRGRKGHPADQPVACNREAAICPPTIGGAKRCTESPAAAPRSFPSRSAWRLHLTQTAIHRMAIAIGIEARINTHSLSAPATAAPRKVWTSGHRTSTSFATRDGDAGRKPTARIRS